MCKFDKNTNYTTTQIAEEIIKVRPYANLHSCRTQVCIYIKREGIKSVNGQVKHGVYCGLDAGNIYNYFTSSVRKYEVKPKEVVETLKKVEKLPFDKAIDEAIEEAKTHESCIYLDNISGLRELATLLNRSVEEVAFEAILLQIESWKNMSVSDFIKRRA